MLLLSSCVRYKPVLYRNDGRIELVFVMKDYPRVLNCYREIWVSPKIRQVDRVVNEYSSTVELVVHTYDGRRVIAAYSTFVDLYALTPLLRFVNFVTDLLYNLFP